MAKIIYEVYQNKNEHTAAYGKFYARVKNLESLNTRKLANHISEHGSIYTPDVVYGVLEKFRSCLLEMLLNSKKVKIEGLGTFYTTIECAKGGALTKDKFSVNKDIKGLHIRFLPEQEQEQNISSREFLKQAEFINVESLTKKEEEENGTTGNGGSQSGGSQSGEQGGNQAKLLLISGLIEYGCYCHDFHLREFQDFALFVHLMFLFYYLNLVFQ